MLVLGAENDSFVYRGALDATANTYRTKAEVFPDTPPVLPFGKFSPPIRAREKRVISKAVTEWAGYRPRRLPPPEAHLPSLFGRFLRRLGTTPI